MMWKEIMVVMMVSLLGKTEGCVGGCPPNANPHPFCPDGFQVHCFSDSDCTPPKKCCRTGCSNQCVAPCPGPHGFCGFPCTLHNKTYELCPCDVNNVNQSYSVGVNDTTLFTENFGDENKTDWECYTRSGRFYVVRRYIAHNLYEYRCMRDIMYNTTKDLRVYCMSEWAQFPGNPSLCDVCDGSAFDKDTALIIKEQSEKCGTIILPPGFCGCALPTICPVTNNVTQTQCDACESSEGNDDGLCCS